MEFDYYLPINLKFGSGRVSEVGEILVQYGKKVLIVTGRSSTKKTGLLDRVIDSVKKQGLECEVFDKVTENPLTTTAIEGSLLVKERGCDVVLGVGGGSVMDCSKAIAFLAASVNNPDKTNGSRPAGCNYTRVWHPPRSIGLPPSPQTRAA